MSTDTPRDGGPAFPHRICLIKDRSQIDENVSGMSLRDYFAAKVLPAAVAQFY